MERSPDNKDAGLSSWEVVFGPIPLADAAETAHSASYYAKYPAELADELAADFTEYLQHDTPSTLQNDLKLSSTSPLVESEDFWRIFKSILPVCPIDHEPFLRFQSAVWENNAESYRSALREVQGQIERFGLWLEAADLWSTRPPKSQSKLIPETEPPSVKELAELYSKSPDAAVAEFNSILVQLGQLYTEYRGDPEDFEFSGRWEWFDCSPSHSADLQAELADRVDKFHRAVRIAQHTGSDYFSATNTAALQQLGELLRASYTVDKGVELLHLSRSLATNRDELTYLVDLGQLPQSPANGEASGSEVNNEGETLEPAETKGAAPNEDTSSVESSQLDVRAKLVAQFDKGDGSFDEPWVGDLSSGEPGFAYPRFFGGETPESLLSWLKSVMDDFQKCIESTGTNAPSSDQPDTAPHSDREMPPLSEFVPVGQPIRLRLNPTKGKRLRQCCQLPWSTHTLLSAVLLQLIACRQTYL